MTSPNLSLVPCPCCGQTLTKARRSVIGGLSVYGWTCQCGAEYDGEDDPSLRAVLSRLLNPPHRDPSDPPPALFVTAVLRGLGLGDDDLRALATGARLEVRR